MCVQFIFSLEIPNFDHILRFHVAPSVVMTSTLKPDFSSRRIASMIILCNTVLDAQPLLKKHAKDCTHLPRNGNNIVQYLYSNKFIQYTSL